MLAQRTGALQTCRHKQALVDSLYLLTVDSFCCYFFCAQFKEILVGWIVGAAILEPPAVVSTVFRAAAGRAAKAKAAGGGAGGGAAQGVGAVPRPPTGVATGA